MALAFRLHSENYFNSQPKCTTLQNAESSLQRTLHSVIRFKPDTKDFTTIVRLSKAKLRIQFLLLFCFINGQKRKRSFAAGFRYTRLQKDYGINNCHPLFSRFYLFRFLFALQLSRMEECFLFSLFLLQNSFWFS